MSMQAALDTAPLLLQSLDSQTYQYAQLLIGAAAIDALLDSSTVDFSSLRDAWSRCLDCIVTDSESFERCSGVIATLQQQAHALLCEGGAQYETGVAIIDQWGKEVLDQLHFSLVPEMSGATRGRRSKKKKSPLKPFVAGAFFAAVLGVGYVWFKSRQSGVVPRLREMLERRMVVKKDDSYSAVNGAVTRFIQPQPMMLLNPHQPTLQELARREGKEWVAVVAPELLTYLQEHKGLVVHQVLQDKMLITIPGEALRDCLAATAVSMGGFCSHQDLITQWQRDASRERLARLALTVTEMDKLERLRSCLADETTMRCLVSALCFESSGKGVCASFVKMIVNQQQDIPLLERPNNPLFSRYPAYASVFTQLLVRVCAQEMSGFVHESARRYKRIDGVTFGTPFAAADSTKIELFAALGGRFFSLDSMIFLLRNNPREQLQCMAILIDEVIIQICKRYGVNELSLSQGRNHLIGSLWQNRQVRQILSALYDEEVRLGSLTPGCAVQEAAGSDVHENANEAQ